MNKAVSTIKEHVIAGSVAGNKVCANTPVFMVYRNLHKLAQQGDHWARVCVSHLHSLSSGHFKDTVFVHQNNPFDKIPNFTMILPGCKAQVLKRPNGEYFVYSLEVDANYHSLQKDFIKPALFNVNKGIEDEWTAELVASGQVKVEKGRVVTISDQCAEIDNAAKASARAAGDSPSGGQRHINLNGFDMHFTPGKIKIGGLRQLKQARNADSDPALHESALLLARTMASARNIESVSWISEGGGSGVLTQAMRILKDQGVSFGNSDHHVYFSNMTTRLVKAQGLASDIGMKFDRKFHNTKYLNPNQLIGGLGFGGAHLAAYYRFRQNPEHTALKLGSDLVNETLAAKSAAGTVGITTAAVGAALGITLTGGSIGACAAFASAAMAIGVTGTKLWEAWFPESYGKFKGKF